MSGGTHCSHCECIPIQIWRFGFEPWLGHCVIVLGKTFNFHTASLHPGVQMGTGESNAGSNPAMD